MSNGALLPPAPPRRILALWLPCLSTDRCHRQSRGRSWRLDRSAHSSHAKKNGDASSRVADAPFALVGKVKNALRLVAVDETAARLGLARGTALADARAMIPALLVADEDPSADQALLASIADWAECYTPLVALDDDGLFLDITGCAHLFGGEDALHASLGARLEAQGFLARVAIADTPGAAWAAARFGEPGIVPPGESAHMLAPLLIAALRLDPEIVSAMERVGLKRIGQIIDAPRAPLAARFGSGLAQQLDRALGIEEEPISPRRAPPVFIAERRFAEPIAREEDITAALTSLATAIAAPLESHGEGARRLEYSLFRVDGAVTRIVVGTGRPIRAAKLILALFREKFTAFGDEIDAGYGFDMARLSVTASAPAASMQVDLTGEGAAAADVDDLIDRIDARLGEGTVAAVVPRESHIPERAEIVIPYGRRDGMGDAGHTASSRPLRLFARPEPIVATAEVPDGPPINFRWRSASYRVAHAEGPERIALEWWRGDGPTRDYFRVEDETGHRFWIYRDGLYADTTTPPVWYVHGVFA
jgi:protein ImuB